MIIIIIVSKVIFLRALGLLFINNDNPSKRASERTSVVSKLIWDQHACMRESRVRCVPYGMLKLGPRAVLASRGYLGRRKPPSAAECSGSPRHPFYVFIISHDCTKLLRSILPRIFGSTFKPKANRRLVIYNWVDESREPYRRALCWARKF